MDQDKYKMLEEILTSITTNSQEPPDFLDNFTKYINSDSLNNVFIDALQLKIKDTNHILKFIILYIENIKELEKLINELKTDNFNELPIYYNKKN